MKNYFEKTNIDNKEIIIETTDNDIYLGYKDDNNLKTLYTYSKDEDEIMNDYMELKHSKYKNSNLINKIKELLILGKTKDIMSNIDFYVENNITKQIGKKDISELKINEILKNHNIDCFCYKNTLIHNDYKKIIEKTEKILSDGIFFVENEDLIKLLPDEYGIGLSDSNYIEKIIEDIEDIYYNNNKEMHIKEFEKYDELNPYNFPITSIEFLETRLNLWKYNIKFVYPNEEMKEKTIKYIENIIEIILKGYELYKINENCLISTYKAALIGEVK